MNAINFIKQHGIEKSREVVQLAPDGATHLSNDTRHYVNADFKPLPTHIKEQLPKLIVIDHLKHLVESVDLVEHFGNDIGGAKQLLEFSKDCKTIELSGSVITVERLKQAIADYESIYSNDMVDDEHIENHVSPNCKVGVK